MGQLNNKTAVVLGAAGRDNMGQVIARRFAAEGAKVVVAGRNAEELNRFAKDIGGRAFVCDVTKLSDIEALAAFSLEAGNGIGVALNATGWGLLAPFLETTDEQLDQMCALIQISSATATIMLNDHAAYMGAKAGIDHVVRCVANEFGDKGVRANSVSPGLTETPMTAQAAATPGLFDAFLPSYPLGRIGTSQDIAEACVFLASDACFMTGQNLQVNGGLTLRRNPNRDEISASIMKAMSAKA